MLLSFLQFIFMFSYTVGSAFPEPLSHEEEERSIALMSEGDTLARNTLIEHNLRLVAHIVKKYTNYQKESDELISIGTVGLIKGVSTYKPEKGCRLATYAARCIENEILMHLRRNKKRQNDVSLQESVGIDKEGNEVTLEEKLADESRSVEDATALKMTVERLYRAMKQRLTPREREIITLRYGLNGEKEVTQREIAQSMGISRSYVSRIETKALSKLKDL